MSQPVPSEPVNPYIVTPGHDEVIAAQIVEGPPRHKPRVWTVFVTILASIVLLLASQVIAAIVLVAAYIIRGGTPQELQADVGELAGDPAFFLFFGGLGQLTLAGTALGAAWLSPQPLAKRLGFVRPAWPGWMTGLAVAGSIVPFAVGIGLAYSIIELIPPDPSVEKLYENMTPALALPWILFIALAPGFSEEMLFRGYAQRRLIERWPAWVAILVTSFIFAIFHVMPHTVLFAFPLGIWLGMMAWKSGSIWPGVICHAAINGLWNVFQVGARFEVFPEEPPLAAIIGLIAVGTVAFAASLWGMYRR